MNKSAEKSVFHLTGLNGIRAIAAMGVIVFHLNPKFGLPETMLGPSGVTIFFTLSGFLITLLLIKEKEHIKDIHINKFYIRRVLRIWPLYYFYMALAIIVSQEYNHNLFFYLFFSGNIPFSLTEPYPYLGHYWSLAVEEQFYLFWPLLIKYSKNITRNILLVIISYFVLKLGVNLLLGGHSDLYRLLYISKFDCMAIGGLAANQYYYRQESLNFLNNWYFQVLAWCIIVLIAFNKFHLISLIDPYFVAITTIILIVNQSSKKFKLINLNNTVLNFLGKISFGLYVYHGLIIHLSIAPLRSIIKNPVLVYVCLLAIVTAVAYLSYILLEKPFLKLKSKHAIIQSRSS